MPAGVWASSSDDSSDDQEDYSDYPRDKEMPAGVWASSSDDSSDDQEDYNDYPRKVWLICYKLFCLLASIPCQSLLGRATACHHDKTILPIRLS